jgi:hypothetical protein
MFLAFYKPCTSHISWRDNSNYTWRTVQVMKLLIVQFSPKSCYFLSLQSKHFSQHPVLIYPQSMHLSQPQIPSFTSVQNNRQNDSCVYSNFYVFRQIKFWSVTVVLQYLNCATFSKELLSLFMAWCALHSGDGQQHISTYNEKWFNYPCSQLIVSLL